MLDTDLKFCEKDLIEEIDLFNVPEGLRVRHRFTQNENKVVNTVTVSGKTYAYGNLMPDCTSEIERKRYVKRFAKLAIYKALSMVYGKNPAWGALTGIRPTKLAYSEMEEGRDFRSFFINTMRVSPQKTQLTEKVIINQEGIYSKDENNTDFFIFIPFCPSRCKYCSFITADIKSAREKVDEYVDALVYEIEQSIPLIKNLRSIYIGGGTPVALSNEHLEKILSAVDKFNTGVEFTVEAGRPDRITKENLEILKKHRVTRICINPQTFNDKTLKTIGRAHTAKDIEEKYQLAKKQFIVNMDLIAGLDGECFEDFKFSIDKAISLNPDNITVHTLSIKKGSELAKEKNRLSEEGISEMIDYAENTLERNGYLPYYLYRQKYMSGNLENVGYTKEGKACIYNVDIMEETTDIIACGAGAISKKVDSVNEKILRVPAPKDVVTYISKVDKILLEKNEIFCLKRCKSE